MNLDKTELIKLLGITENTWRKKNKAQQEQLINKNGYRLIGSYRVERFVYYQIESRGEELLRVIKFLKDHELEARNPKALLNFLVAITMDETKQLIILAEELNISTATAYNWINKLEDQGLLKKEERALKVRYSKTGKREICSEEQWKEFVDFYKECSPELLPAQIYHAWAHKTGYSYRQASIVKSNGFYEEFFSLLEKASNQLED